MSLILEALDKAEAERALGEVPGLHAPVTASLLLPPTPAAAWRSWLPGLALVALLVLAAVFWYRQPTAVLAPAAPPVPAAVPAPTAVAPPPSPVSPPSPAQPQPAPLAARTPAPAAITKAPKPTPAAEAPRLKKSAPAASAPLVDEPLPTLRELPEPIQREIPALSIGGYIYSDNRAERSLLLNNKLLREGDEVASGLTLEKMLPKAAILNYKGYRYRIAY